MFLLFIQTYFHFISRFIEFGSFSFLRKQIKLATLSIKDAKYKVRIENEYYSIFEIKTEVRQSDGLSLPLFDFALEGAQKS